MVILTLDIMFLMLLSELLDLSLCYCLFDEINHRRRKKLGLCFRRDNVNAKNYIWYYYIVIFLY